MSEVDRGEQGRGAMNEETHGYIGLRPCGCVETIIVDCPEEAAEIAKVMRRLASQGGWMERAPIEDCRRAWLGRCAEHTVPKVKP